MSLEPPILTTNAASPAGGRPSPWALLWFKMVSVRHYWNSSFNKSNKLTNKKEGIGREQELHHDNKSTSQRLQVGQPLLERETKGKNAYVQKSRWKPRPKELPSRCSSGIVRCWSSRGNRCRGHRVTSWAFCGPHRKPEFRWMWSQSQPSTVRLKCFFGRE